MLNMTTEPLIACLSGAALFLKRQTRLSRLIVRGAAFDVSCPLQRGPQNAGEVRL